MNSRASAARVQDQVGIAVGGRVQVDSGPPQPRLEFSPVRRGGDDDGRAALGERAQQVARHPLGQFLVPAVELNDMLTSVMNSVPTTVSPSGEVGVQVPAAYLPSKRRGMHPPPSSAR